MPGTITDSRLKSGTLTLGTDQFECQATNVRLTPDTQIDTGGEDAIETLCGQTTSTSEDVTVTTSWTLAVEAIQDFTNAAGFQQFCMDNGGTIKDFSWKPNATGPTFSGRCRIVPVEIGGEVKARLTTSAEFPVVGTPNVVRTLAATGEK